MLRILHRNRTFAVKTMRDSHMDSQMTFQRAQVLFIGRKHRCHFYTKIGTASHTWAHTSTHTDSESEMPSHSVSPISLPQIWIINTSTWTLKLKFLKTADFETFQDYLEKQTLNCAIFMILSLIEVLGHKLGVPFSKMYLCSRRQGLWELSRHLQALCYFSLLQIHDFHHQSNQL